MAHNNIDNVGVFPSSLTIFGNIQDDSDDPPLYKTYFIRRKSLEICLAEVFGTFILMFFGCMSLISGFDQMGIPSMQPALIFGFAVSTIITIFGHISCAHLNPAVTIAALILGQVSLVDSLIYILGQCIGCILGYVTLGIVTPSDILLYAVSPERGLCSTIPNDSLSDFQAFLAEYLATSVIIFTCCGVWDHRNTHGGDAVPIKFAFAVMLCSITVGPYTGASMNPARSLAPAFVNNVWKRQWIYFTAPTLAGIITPLVYMYVFEPQRLDRGEDDSRSQEMRNRVNEAYSKH